MGDLNTTRQYIRNKTPIWCYTLNYKTKKVKERTGHLVCFYSPTRAMFRDDNEPRSWASWTLNGLSSLEATVRGATIWYTEPSLDKAIDAFKKAGMKMSDDYDLKSMRSYYRSSRLEVANGN